MAQPSYSPDGTVVTYTLLENVANTNANSIYTVNTITVDNPGNTYNYAPQLRIKSNSTGYGAEAIATIGSNVADANTYGKVVSIKVTNQGSGYNPADPPSVEFYDKRTESIGTIIINNSGAGYGGGPAYLNIQPPNDPNYPTPPQTGKPEQAVGNVELTQNSVSAVIIGTTGKGYSYPPSVTVSPAQNNYPAVAAQLTAVLNTGTNATAHVNLLPTYIGDPVQGGSYYLRNSSIQMVTSNIANTTPAFSGNIFLQGTLDGNSWFNISKLDKGTLNVNANAYLNSTTIIGKYVSMRIKVADYANGVINNIKLTYGYNG